MPREDDLRLTPASYGELVRAEWLANIETLIDRAGSDPAWVVPESPDLTMPLGLTNEEVARLGGPPNLGIPASLTNGPTKGSTAEESRLLAENARARLGLPPRPVTMDPEGMTDGQLERWNATTEETGEQRAARLLEARRAYGPPPGLPRPRIN